MHKIQILGTGCAKCLKLTDATRLMATELGLPFELEKVTDMMRFADFGVMVTPALVVDGKVLSSGRLPSTEELRKLLQGVA
jgi:small redox-active disulfide protein 2